MSTIGKRIESKAIEIINSNPKGIRHSDLVDVIHQQLPDHPNINTIRGEIWDLDKKRPKEIFKPSRGVYRHIDYRDIEEREEGPKISEESYYQSVAEYLRDELTECTKVVTVGGNKFGSRKWTTPDVVGVLKPGPGELYPSPMEIISAEVKTEVGGESLVTAFGQACSYRLFSHRSYIVVPKQSPPDEIDRVEALCIIFGIGLILFDAREPKTPRFEIRVRASKYDPDPWYTNQTTQMKELRELF